MRSRHLIWCLLLGACADPWTIARLETAKGDFRARVENTHMMVQFDLAKPNGLSQSERERREARAAVDISPACVKPYTERLRALLSAAAAAVQASHSTSVLDPLPSQAAALDIEFDRCLSKFDVTGYNFMETADGQAHRVPEYLSLATAPLREYENARADAADERQRNAALLLAALTVAASTAVNADQIRVQQYSRRDGTVVQSHMRTVPNDTCFDNIRGCRGEPRP
jgi:hypothetical protein